MQAGAIFAVLILGVGVFAGWREKRARGATVKPPGREVIPRYLHRGAVRLRRRRRDVYVGDSKVSWAARCARASRCRYPADGLHNDAGATAIARAPLHSGDTVLGFSLGSQVISLYLAQHTPPPGVRFVLLGDTFARNDELVAHHGAFHPTSPIPVTFVVREYDGWSDKPTNKASRLFRSRNAQRGIGCGHPS